MVSTSTSVTHEAPFGDQLIKMAWVTGIGREDTRRWLSASLGHPWTKFKGNNAGHQTRQKLMEEFFEPSDGIWAERSWNFTLDASSKCHLWDLPHRCAQWHPYHPYNPFKLPNLVPVKGLLGMGCSLHLAPIVQRFCRKDPITLYCSCCGFGELHYNQSNCCAMFLIQNFSPVWGAPSTIWLVAYTPIISCQTFDTFSNRLSLPNPCMRWLNVLAPFSICVISWQRWKGEWDFVKNNNDWFGDL